MGALLPIIFPAVSYSLGKNDAKKEIADYKPCDKSNSVLKGCAFITQDGKAIANGRIVTSSETYVAVFDGANTKVIPIDLKEIEIVVK